jgi:transposase
MTTAAASSTSTASARSSQFGSAPIEASIGERVVHRLSRSGDRKLNSALHLLEVNQVRTRGSAGRSYFERKIDEGKTRNEAMRCLKRKLASHIWRRKLADEHARTTEATRGPRKLSTFERG